MGADALVDYAKENVLSRQAAYDIVIDLSGKMSYKNAKHIMRPTAMFLNPTPKPIEIPVSFFKNLFTAKKHVIILSSPATKYTDVLLHALKTGLEIEVNKVFPFAQYREAYQYAEQGGYTGKVVVEIN
jgi:NADPH:quinone reductase-like Zn-dependent oxidoreductase